MGERRVISEEEWNRKVEKKQADVYRVESRKRVELKEIFTGINSKGRLRVKD